MKIKLIYPAGYLDLTPEQKSKICNGAGPAEFIDLVPDTMWGLNMNPTSDIHDYCYFVGKTRFDKIVSDCLYAYNSFAYIMNESFYLMTFLRKNRAMLYVEAVNAFGDTWFFTKGKCNLGNKQEFSFMEDINHAKEWLEIIEKFVLFCGKKSIKFKLLNKIYTNDEINYKFPEIISCIIREYELQNKKKVMIENEFPEKSFFKTEENYKRLNFEDA